MNEIRIDGRISYIECTMDPLSADIILVQSDSGVWLYDVGSDERRAEGLNGPYHVVLSHFHQDHTGNLGRIPLRSLYVSKETLRHTGMGTVVDRDTMIGDIHLFPLPSSHARGCLGMEAGDYALVGDALYCRHLGNERVYNAQLLHDEIAVLKALQARKLLVSHRPGLIQDKAEAIAELEAIYRLRTKDDPWIRLHG